jgi:hypothetical protein
MYFSRTYHVRVTANTLLDQVLLEYSHYDGHTWVLETLKAMGIENPPQVWCTQMHSVMNAITRSTSMVDSAEQ